MLPLLQRREGLGIDPKVRAWFVGGLKRTPPVIQQGKEKIETRERGIGEFRNRNRGSCPGSNEQIRIMQLKMVAT